MTRYRLSLLLLGSILVLVHALWAQPAVEFTYVYDARGRLVRVTDSAGNVRRYLYDASGNLVSIQHTTVEQLVPPTITLLTPEHLSLSVGEEVAVQIHGTALQEAFVSSDNPGLQITRRSATAGRLSLTLLAMEGIRPGTTTLTVSSPDGSASSTLEIEVIFRVREETLITAGDVAMEHSTLLVENTRLVIDGSHTFTSLVLRNSTLLVRGLETLTAQRVSLAENSVLTHAAGTSHIQLNVTNLHIDASSLIDASGRGFLGGRQEGNPQEQGQTVRGQAGSTLGNGGSYGGLGGQGSTGNAAAPVYDDLRQPQLPGSGGGASAGSSGGNGGGQVRLTAAEIVLEGAILANGGPGSGLTGAGGSGGAIWISTDLLTGHGRLAANGGDTESPDSGSGGGGRIAVEAGSTAILGTARGGAAALQHGEHGAAGTVFMRQAGQLDGDLIVDNGGSNGAITPLRAIGFGTNSALTVTVLRNENAAFAVPEPAIGALGVTGLRVNPNIQQPQTFPIVENTATTLRIAAPDDFTQVATLLDAYLGVYTFENVTIRGAARVVTADAVAVRFLLSLENATSLRSDLQVGDSLLPTLEGDREQRRDILITLAEPATIPTRIVAVSGNPDIATVTAASVIAVGQRTGVVSVALGEPGVTTLTITAASQLLVVRVLVEQPPMAGSAIASQTGAFTPQTALPGQSPVFVTPVEPPTITLHIPETDNVFLPIPVPVPTGGAEVIVASDHPAIATVSAPARLAAGEQRLPLRITSVAHGRTLVRGRVGTSAFLLQVLVDVPPPAQLSAAPVLLFRPLSQPGAVAVSGPLPVPVPAVAFAGAGQPEPTLAPLIKIDVAP